MSPPALHTAHASGYIRPPMHDRQRGGPRPAAGLTWKSRENFTPDSTASWKHCSALSGSSKVSSVAPGRSAPSSTSRRRRGAGPARGPELPMAAAGAAPRLGRCAPSGWKQTWRCRFCTSGDAAQGAAAAPPRPPRPSAPAAPEKGAGPAPPPRSPTTHARWLRGQGPAPSFPLRTRWLLQKAPPHPAPLPAGTVLPSGPRGQGPGLGLVHIVRLGRSARSAGRRPRADSATVGLPRPTRSDGGAADLRSPAGALPCGPKRGTPVPTGAGGGRPNGSAASMSPCLHLLVFAFFFLNQENSHGTKN